MKMLQLAMYAMAQGLNGRTRKGGVPHITHLASCIQIVGAYGGGEVTQTAACLHDAINDLAWRPIKIQREYDEKVADICSFLAEDKTLPWRERKQKVIDLAKACDQPTAIVLLADKIDRISTLLREVGSLEETDEGWAAYWAKESAGYADRCWFYRGLFQALFDNMVVRTNRDYPDLRTFDALLELKHLINRFASA